MAHFNKRLPYICIEMEIKRKNASRIRNVDEEERHSGKSLYSIKLIYVGTRHDLQIALHESVRKNTEIS
jgi:hypothetical protein